MQKSKKKADQDKAAHIKMLARMYPGLRIAHVDEKDGSFYSVLSKHGGGSGDEMVEEYRVKVRNCKAGEGNFCCRRLLHREAHQCSPRLEFVRMFVCASI